MSAYGGTRTMYQARSASDPSINKQIICRHIAAGRVCAAGATCVFAHTEAELRGPLRDLFLHCENAAPQHIERLRAEGVNCLNDLVDAAIAWSRNGHAARAPPGVVAVAIADLYGYCKQHCPGMLVRLDRTALAKGDYDRAGVKPGWVGYYVDPALQRSGREYVDADESQWAKLEATGGASLEKILELVCDEVPGRAEEARAAGAPDNAACALARDIKKCAAAAQFVGAQFVGARNSPRRPALPTRYCRDAFGIRINFAAAVVHGALVEGGTPPRDWIAMAPEQPPPVPHWAERHHGGGGGGGNGGNGAMATGGAPAAAARIAPVPPPGATARPWSAAAAPPGRAPAPAPPVPSPIAKPNSFGAAPGPGTSPNSASGPLWGTASVGSVIDLSPQQHNGGANFGKDKGVWAALSADERQAAGDLGWTAAGWDRGVAPPACARPWASLSVSERRAAEALGYRATNWDGDLQLPHAGIADLDGLLGSSALNDDDLGDLGGSRLGNMWAEPPMPPELSAADAVPTASDRSSAGERHSNGASGGGSSGGGGSGGGGGGGDLGRAAARAERLISEAQAAVRDVARAAAAARGTAPADAQPSAGAVAAQMKAERARADAAELQLRRLRGDDGALAGLAAEEAQKLLGEANQGVERITRFIAQQQRAKGR